MQFERRYRFYVLAPPSVGRHSRSFTNVALDAGRHRQLLSEAQRLRGKIYLEDGAIRSCDLDGLGRFKMHDDENSWHLVLTDPAEQVIGCMRYLVHSPDVQFQDLHVRHAAACSGQGAPNIQIAIERDLQLARTNRLSYVEVGGWAIVENWRHTKAALDMIGSSYALGELWGGSLGICTATARHSSAPILRKFGASPLVVAGQPLPPYEDERFQCAMELLRFDRVPAQRFAPLIDPLKCELRSASVLVAAPSVIRIATAQLAERQVA